MKIGDIVHYVLNSGRSKGQHRPAIIVRTWQTQPNLVNLQVFTDGFNDEYQEFVASVLSSVPGMMGIVPANIIWRTSVLYSATAEPDTWHWPEEEE